VFVALNTLRFYFAFHYLSIFYLTNV